MPAGRPVTEKYKSENLIPQISAYLDDCRSRGLVPILKEFCLKHGLHYAHIEELARADDELAHTIKRITASKEVALERGALDGSLIPSAAIFSLKQLGWSDKTEQTISGPNGGPVEVSDVSKLPLEDRKQLLALMRKMQAEPQ